LYINVNAQETLGLLCQALKQKNSRTKVCKLNAAHLEHIYAYMLKKKKKTITVQFNMAFCIT